MGVAPADETLPPVAVLLHLALDLRRRESLALVRRRRHATRLAVRDHRRELGIGQGREFNSSWDNEYDFRPINIGNYWDKVLAIQSLTDSDAFFFRDLSHGSWMTKFWTR